MNQETATVRARIVGRPKKNPGHSGPGSVNVKINSLIAKMARVLANSEGTPLSDFLDRQLTDPITLMFRVWRRRIKIDIAIVDRERPTWRQDLVQMLGEYQASGLDYIDVMTKHLADPKLSEEDRKSHATTFELVKGDHQRYLDEILLKDIDAGGTLIEYGNEAEMEEADEVFRKIKGAKK